MYPVTFEDFLKFTNVEELVIQKMKEEGPTIYEINYKHRHKHCKLIYKTFYDDHKRVKAYRLGLVLKPMPQSFKAKFLQFPTNQDSSSSKIAEKQVPQKQISLEDKYKYDMPSTSSAFLNKVRFKSETKTQQEKSPKGNPSLKKTSKTGRKSRKSIEKPSRKFSNKAPDIEPTKITNFFTAAQNSSKNDAVKSKISEVTKQLGKRKSEPQRDTECTQNLKRKKITFSKQSHQENIKSKNTIKKHKSPPKISSDDFVSDDSQIRLTCSLSNQAHKTKTPLKVNNGDNLGGKSKPDEIKSKHKYKKIIVCDDSRSEDSFDDRLKNERNEVCIAKSPQKIYKENKTKPKPKSRKKVHKADLVRVDCKMEKNEIVDISSQASRSKAGSAEGLEDIFSPKYSPLPKRKKSEDLKTSPTTRKDFVERNLSKKQVIERWIEEGQKALYNDFVVTEPGVKKRSGAKTTPENISVGNKIQTVKTYIENVKKYIKYWLKFEIQMRKGINLEPTVLNGPTKTKIANTFSQMTFDDFKNLMNTSHSGKSLEEDFEQNCKSQFEAFTKKDKPWPKVHIELAKLESFLSSKGLKGSLQLKDISPRILSFNEVLEKTNIKENISLSCEKPPESYKELLILCQKEYQNCCTEGIWNQGLKFNPQITENAPSQDMSIELFTESMPPSGLDDIQQDKTMNIETYVVKKVSPVLSNSHTNKDINRESIINPNVSHESPEKPKTTQICGPDPNQEYLLKCNDDLEIMMNKILGDEEFHITNNNNKPIPPMDYEELKRTLTKSPTRSSQISQITNSPKLLPTSATKANNNLIKSKEIEKLIPPSPNLFQSSEESDPKCHGSESEPIQESVYVSCQYSNNFHTEQNNFSIPSIDEESQSQDPFAQITLNQEDTNDTIIKGPNGSTTNPSSPKENIVETDINDDILVRELNISEESDLNLERVNESLEKTAENTTEVILEEKTSNQVIDSSINNIDGESVNRAENLTGQDKSTEPELITLSSNHNDISTERAENDGREVTSMVDCTTTDIIEQMLDLNINKNNIVETEIIQKENTLIDEMELTKPTTKETEEKSAAKTATRPNTNNAAVNAKNEVTKKQKLNQICISKISEEHVDHEIRSTVKPRSKEPTRNLNIAKTEEQIIQPLYCQYKENVQSEETYQSEDNSNKTPDKQTRVTRKVLLRPDKSLEKKQSELKVSISREPLKNLKVTVKREILTQTYSQYDADVQFVEMPRSEPVVIDDEETAPELLEALLCSSPKTADQVPMTYIPNLCITSSSSCFYNFPEAQKLPSNIDQTQSQLNSSQTINQSISEDPSAKSVMLDNVEMNANNSDVLVNLPICNELKQPQKKNSDKSCIQKSILSKSLNSDGVKKIMPNKKTKEKLSQQSEGIHSSSYVSIAPQKISSDIELSQTNSDKSRSQKQELLLQLTSGAQRETEMRDNALESGDSVVARVSESCCELNENPYMSLRQSETVINEKENIVCDEIVDSVPSQQSEEIKSLETVVPQLELPNNEEEFGKNKTVTQKSTATLEEKTIDNEILENSSEHETTHHSESIMAISVTESEDLELVKDAKEVEQEGIIKAEVILNTCDVNIEGNNSGDNATFDDRKKDNLLIETEDKVSNNIVALVDRSGDFKTTENVSDDANYSESVSKQLRNKDTSVINLPEDIIQDDTVITQVAKVSIAVELACDADLLKGDNINHVKENVNRQAEISQVIESIEENDKQTEVLAGPCESTKSTELSRDKSDIQTQKYAKGNCRSKDNNEVKIITAKTTTPSVKVEPLVDDSNTFSKEPKEPVESSVPFTDHLPFGNVIPASGKTFPLSEKGKENYSETFSSSSNNKLNEISEDKTYSQAFGTEKYSNGMSIMTSTQIDIIDSAKNNDHRVPALESSHDSSVEFIDITIYSISEDESEEKYSDAVNLAELFNSCNSSNSSTDAEMLESSECILPNDIDFEEVRSVSAYVKDKLRSLTSLNIDEPTNNQKSLESFLTVQGRPVEHSSEKEVLMHLNTSAESPPNLEVDVLLNTDKAETEHIIDPEQQCQEAGPCEDESLSNYSSDVELVVSTDEEDLSNDLENVSEEVISNEEEKSSKSKHAELPTSLNSSIKTVQSPTLPKSANINLSINTGVINEHHSEVMQVSTTEIESSQANSNTPNYSKQLLKAFQMYKNIYRRNLPACSTESINISETREVSHFELPPSTSKTFSLPAFIPISSIIHNVESDSENPNESNFVEVPLMIDQRLLKSLPFSIVTLGQKSNEIHPMNAIRVNLELKLEEQKPDAIEDQINISQVKLMSPTIPRIQHDEKSISKTIMAVRKIQENPIMCKKSCSPKKIATDVKTKQKQKILHPVDSIIIRPDDQIRPNIPSNQHDEKFISSILKTVPNVEENLLRCPIRSSPEKAPIQLERKDKQKRPQPSKKKTTTMKSSMIPDFVPQKTHAFSSLPLAAGQKPPQNKSTCKKTSPLTVEACDYLIEDASQLIAATTASQILGTDCTYFENSELLRNIDGICVPHYPEVPALEIDLVTIPPPTPTAPPISSKVINFIPITMSEGVTARKIWQVNLQWKTRRAMSIEVRFSVNKHFMTACDDSAKLLFNFSSTIWSDVHRVLREIDHFEYKRLALKNKSKPTPLHNVLKQLFGSSMQVIDVKLINDSYSPYTICEKTIPVYRKPYQCLTKGIPSQILNQMRLLKENLQRNNSVEK